MQRSKPNLDNQREDMLLQYGTQAGIWAQQALCERKGYPVFAPQNGQCPSCGGMIFEPGGYTLQQAGNILITGCPYCQYSFCE